MENLKLESMTVRSISRVKPAAAFARTKWSRAVLLGVLAYEAAGCLLGGSMLILSPDGGTLDMQVGIMHGAFPDFLIPGCILFLLGWLNLSAFVLSIRMLSGRLLFPGLALVGLLIWFWVEIAILRQVHWLHLMWGVPVLVGGVAALSYARLPHRTIKNALLACGILSSILYAVITLIAGSQWTGYDAVSQTISELSAIGAPTRFLWITLSLPYTFLMIAFACGVRMAAGTNRAAANPARSYPAAANRARPNRRLLWAGNLLLVYALLGLLWPFVPMHLRDALAAGGNAPTDISHIALGVVTELLYLTALGLTAASLGKRFRIYSIATAILLLFFAVLTFLAVGAVGANQPTPLLGIYERINIGLFLLWIIVLATSLLD